MIVHTSHTSHPHNNNGFSIVETMVYLSVLVLVTGVIVTTFLSLDTVLVRNKTDREMTQSATVALERIVRTVHDATSVTAGQSAFGTSTGALALSSTGTTTRFYIASSTLMMSENGVTVGPLTSESVPVQSFVVTHYTGSSTEMVRVALTLKAQSKAASSTRTFYTGAVLRGTYD